MNKHVTYRWLESSKVKLLFGVAMLVAASWYSLHVANEFASIRFVRVGDFKGPVVQCSQSAHEDVFDRVEPDLLQWKTIARNNVVGPIVLDIKHVKHDYHLASYSASQAHRYRLAWQPTSLRLATICCFRI